MIPTNFEEAMIALDNALQGDEAIWFRSLDKKDLISTHHSLGRWLRNNWGLWKDPEPGNLHDNLLKMGFVHADDMSSSLIREFWNRLHGQPSEIEDDIKEYKEFWEKQNGS